MILKVLIFHPLYLTLHGIFTFFEFLFNTCVYLNQQCNIFFDKSVISNDREYIFKSTRKLAKAPTHLTILLGNEEPSYKDLANLVLWSLAAGISFISFYDYKGVLQKEEQKLQEVIDKEKEDDYHIIWHNGETPCKNGYIGRKIHVRTLSLTDAQDSVVNVAKKLCSVKDKLIDQEIIDDCLKCSYIFPDPDLGIYFGKVFSLFGYPPWQIRLTEFIGLDTHYNISPNDFIGALYRFNKIEQRFGK